MAKNGAVLTYSCPIEGGWSASIIKYSEFGPAGAVTEGASFALPQEGAGVL